MIGGENTEQKSGEVAVATTPVDDEEAFWEWMRAVAPEPVPSYWDWLPEELQQISIDLANKPPPLKRERPVDVICEIDPERPAIPHGSLVDAPTYWVQMRVIDPATGERERVLTEFEPPHHSLFASISNVWVAACKADKRLADAGKWSSWSSPCDVSNSCSHSYSFPHPETGESTFVCALVKAGTRYADETAEAAVHYEMLRIFGHLHFVRPGPYKDSPEMIEVKKQVWRDWQLCQQHVNASPRAAAEKRELEAEGEEFYGLYPTVDEVFEALKHVHVSRPARVCFTHHPQSHNREHPVHGCKIRYWCSQYKEWELA